MTADQLELVPDFVGEQVAAGPGECLVWTGRVTPQGYGRVFVPGTGREVLVHRYVLEQVAGPIPPGHIAGHVCHDLDVGCPGGRCLHRRCANPHHIRAMTRRENNLGGRGGSVQRAKHAAKTHCPAGHPYDDENTYRYLRRGTPWLCRACRACQLQRERARRQR